MLSVRIIYVLSSLQLRYYFLWAKLCFDFVAIVSQWQSDCDEDWALALAREAVIRSLTDRPINRK